jgi:hypothetical protein
MRRTLAIILIISASLVAAGCGQYGKRYEGSGDSAANAATGEEKRVSDETFDDAVRKRDGCTEVEEFESEGSTHTNDPEEKVKYKHNPPHSGDHYEVAEEWGLYDEQRPDVETVHNLEHGHIVITHKGLSEKEQDELLEQARINPYHLLVMPRKQNPKDGVFYTAWTAQLFCERPSAAALQYMIDEWRDQGPELFTDDASLEEMGVDDA